MTSANDRQVGGEHYKKNVFQHWDFVCATGMHYLAACATKYVSRWRDKNGVQDLEKSLHYIEKLKEHFRPLCAATDTPYHVPFEFADSRSSMRDAAPHIARYAAQLPPAEAGVFVAVCHGYYDVAENMVTLLHCEARKKVTRIAEADCPERGRGQQP